MYIRSVSNENEVRQAYTIEEASYPPEAAASQDEFLERVRIFPSYFLVAEEEQTLHGVANGVRLVHDDLSGEGMKQMTDYATRRACISACSPLPSDYIRPSASLHSGIAWHEMRLQLEPRSR